ncbi:MAG: hypothetical protein KAT79_04280 [candidate division Zixibacteria bacterium]|nr:hypothetical protein [candidate division Zixibacteria bacterium]
MVKSWIRRDVAISVVSVLLSFALGIWGGFKISQEFYDKSQEDVRADIINGALTDIILWYHPEMYPELGDSSKYINSGTPWSYLSTAGLDRLFANLLSYQNAESFELLVDRVCYCKKYADAFNDRMTLRNQTILHAPSATKLHNPKAVSYFHSTVKPRADSLRVFLVTHMDELVYQKKGEAAK